MSLFWGTWSSENSILDDGTKGSVMLAKLSGSRGAFSDILNLETTSRGLANSGVVFLQARSKLGPHQV